MKKKKLLIIIVVLLMLITSFFVLTKKPKIKYKKLKELNYNVTYKQAFPDENLRRGVLLCIMRNKCDGIIFTSYYYNYSTEGYDAGSLLSHTPTITVDDLKVKEEEQLSKVDLDKIQDLLSLSAKENVANLQGIEYLINLKRILIKGVTQENIDLSDFNNLTYVSMYEGEIKNITFPANTFEYIWLYNNKITDITIPSALKVKTLYLNDNLLPSITLPEGVETVYLNDNKLTSLVVPASVKTLEAKENNIENITLHEGIEELNLNDNKISNITLPASIKKVVLSKNKISNIDLSTSINIQTLSLSENPIRSIDISNLINLTDLNLIDTKLENAIDLKNNINLIIF